MVRRTPKAPRQELPRLEPAQRLEEGCREVALGFAEGQARAEALRCLDCREPACVDACPLHIDIRSFIRSLLDGDYGAAFRTITETNPFPDICGRVCQHELYCEKACLLGTKLEPVAIGSLERFVADHRAPEVPAMRRNGGPNADVAQALVPAASTLVSRPLLTGGQGSRRVSTRQPKGCATSSACSLDSNTYFVAGPKVAMVGSGPASLIAAHDLTRRGYHVTVFEALHDFGGVLRYGIPPFRLPREVIDEEVRRLRGSGVEFVSDFIVGRTCSLDDLFEEGYAAVFVATGAGLPYLMNIPGEMLIGVYTANEFLTRVNLMEAWRPQSATPVHLGQRAVIVGGGNAAMDAARWARRLGCETTILFRRGRAELRARLEEIEHAEEEGARFEFLAAPVRLLGNDKGVVTGMECLRMRLGEPDESGRPSPVPIEGSEYRIPADVVVAAIGQAPNPTLQRATPSILTRKGKIVVDENGETSVPHVFAGGDVVRGGSTVILAMRDGRAAAQAIHRALSGGVPA